MHVTSSIFYPTKVASSAKVLPKSLLMDRCSIPYLVENYSFDNYFHLPNMAHCVRLPAAAAARPPDGRRVPVARPAVAALLRHDSDAGLRLDAAGGLRLHRRLGLDLGHGAQHAHHHRQLLHPANRGRNPRPGNLSLLQIQVSTIHTQLGLWGPRYL